MLRLIHLQIIGVSYVSKQFGISLLVVEDYKKYVFKAGSQGRYAVGSSMPCPPKALSAYSI